MTTPRNQDAYIDGKLQRALTKWRKRMSVKLLEKRHRGAEWDEDTPASLLRRVRQELEELTRAVKAGAPAEEVEREAADVANMANMAADAYVKRSKAKA